VARRAANIIRNLGGYDNPNLIHVDAGGFSNFYSSSGKIKSNTLMDLHDLMKVDAVNITERELANDADAFQNAIKGRSTPYISANIISKDGSAAFKPYTIAIKNHMSVAIIGIANSGKRSWELNDGNALTIADPIESINNIMNSLTSIDAYVILTDLPRAKLQPLLEAVEGIDLVLGADGYSVTHEPQIIAGVPVIYAGKQGQYLGSMKLNITDDKIIIRDHNLLHLNDEFPEDKKVREIVHAALQQVAKSEEAERAEFGILVEQTTDLYTGYFACGSCHQEHVKQWRSTKHASAYQGLHSGVRKPDNTCLPCHTTGMGDGGFVDKRVTGYLTNVQCESCHGFGRDHVANPENVAMPKKVTKDSCSECHDIAKSPDFSPEKYWQMIKH
jgi:2',3'-cyclic-nucleotide 2'-phosphodiesterase (5'-nucleotidase family)